MTPETAQQVLHALGLGVGQLRESLAEASGREAKLAIEMNGRDFDISRLRTRATELEAELGKTKSELREVKTELAQRKAIDPQHQKNRERVDHLSLGLWNVIEKIDGQRAASKTKTEAKALGHILADLQDLYGPRTDGKPWVS